jgi:hypothetical protein
MISDDTSRRRLSTLTRYLADIHSNEGCKHEGHDELEDHEPHRSLDMNGGLRAFVNFVVSWFVR